jgi:5-methylcytosine-specific restriction endonuclease McrA
MKKTCTRCGEEKPLEDYHRNHVAKDGRNPRCKKCAIEVAAQWQKDNRDRHAEFVRAYAQSNPVAVREKNRRAKIKRKRLLASAEQDDHTALEIFERDAWICQLCFEPIDAALKHPNVRAASRDHVVPISCGGDDTRENVQAAHYECNLRKGNRVEEVSCL